MIKFFLFFLVIVPGVFASDFFDNNASKITESDIELMQEFDNLSYKLADTKLHILDTDSIFAYIKQHKKYIHDYSLVTVDLNAKVGVDDYDYVAENERDKNYKKIYVSLSYPLFDQKTRKDISNKKLEYNFKILKEINKYTKLKDQLEALKRELSFNRLIQIKLKLQVKRGIKYLEDKLTIIEAILKLQNTILETTTNLNIERTILLNYVKKQFRKNLKEML